MTADQSADALARRLFVDALGALELYTVYVGERLGLYRALADGGPATSSELAGRTGLESVRSVAQALIQAERYGTPVAMALRVLAQESRDMRMNEAEKKAAALPPKLTVPMILLFLPVLFIVILGPAAIRVMQMNVMN